MRRLAAVQESRQILDLIVNSATTLLSVEGAGLRLRDGDELVVSARTESVATIMERIKHSKDRPSLTQKKSYVDEVEEVLHERIPMYKAACDHIIPTDDRTLEEIADEIQSKM